MAGPTYSPSEACLATITIKTLLLLQLEQSEVEACGVAISGACGIEILDTTVGALKFKILNQVDLGREIARRIDDEYPTENSALNRVVTALKEFKPAGYIKEKENNLRKEIDPVWKGLFELGYLKHIDKSKRVYGLEGFDLKEIKSWRKSIEAAYAEKNKARKTEDRGTENEGARAMDTPTNLPRTGVSAEGFFGREEKLKEIQDKLVQLGAAIALSGMAGAGKTELALQFANESMRNFSGGICWIPVGEKVTSDKDNIKVFNLIADEITSFARSILEIKIPDDFKLPVEQLRYSLRIWNQKAKGDILIIVDDIQIYEHVRSFLDELDRFPRFRLVVTSRFADTGNLPLELIEVDVLTQADALKLLKYLVKDGRIVDPATDVEKQLCHCVGNLPLALECLGKYLERNKGVTVANLLEQLRRLAEDSILVEHASLIFRTETRIGITAQRGVIATFDLTWGVLSENDKFLGKLIGKGFRDTEFLVWELVVWVKEEFADSDPSLSYLHQLRDDQLISSRQVLIAYSLLKDVDDEGLKFRIHPLVLEYFRYKKKQEV